MHFCEEKETLRTYFVGRSYHTFAATDSQVFGWWLKNFHLLYTTDTLVYQLQSEMSYWQVENSLRDEDTLVPFSLTAASAQENSLRDEKWLVSLHVGGKWCSSFTYIRNSYKANNQYWITRLYIYSKMYSNFFCQLNSCDYFSRWKVYSRQRSSVHLLQWVRKELVCLCSHWIENLLIRINDMQLLIVGSHRFILVTSTWWNWSLYSQNYPVVSDCWTSLCLYMSWVVCLHGLVSTGAHERKHRLLVYIIYVWRKQRWNQIDAIEQCLSNEIHSGFKWFYLIWKVLYVTIASGRCMIVWCSE